MRYQYEIGDKICFFQADEALHTAAELLAGILREQEEQHTVLQNGKLLQIGWNFFQVTEENGQFQLLARDYLKNPVEDTTPDLSLALTIFQGQRNAVRNAQVTPLDTAFQDTLLVRRAAVQAERIYFLRESPPKDGDSGWICNILGGGHSNDPEEWVNARTFQLCLFCREALDVIHFPVGTIAVFEHGHLIEAVDRDNRKLLGTKEKL